MKMFNPITPRAGSVRIGEPPSKKKNHPSKLDHFEFCLPEKDGKYYPKDEYMHEKFGEEPVYFGPIYLKSDNIVESFNLQLSWWGSGRIKSRRKCFKMLDPFCGGDVDDGRPASQLKKNKETGDMQYTDRICLGNECADFKAAGKCSPGLCFKFWMPGSSRLGEYWLSAGSYASIASAFGFIEMMKKGLIADPDSGSIIGLSQIPLAFVLKKTSVRFKGADVPVYYPELVIDRKVVSSSREQGLFNALPLLVSNDEKRMLLSGKATSRMQSAEADSALLEDDSAVFGDSDKDKGFTQQVESKEGPHEAHAVTSSSPLQAEEKTVFVVIPDTENELDVKVSRKDTEVKIENKVIDIEPESQIDDEYDTLELTEEEEFLVSSELEELSAVGNIVETAVIDEAVGASLIDSILKEEESVSSNLLKKDLTSNGEFDMISQIISKDGTQKTRKSIASIQDDFKEVSSGIWMKEDSDGEVCSFIFSTKEDLPSEIADRFMNSRWTLGKIRSRLMLKGAEYTRRKLLEFKR